MSYRPEQILLQLYHLQDLDCKWSKAATQWDIEIVYENLRRTVPLNQGAVTNALFCDRDNAQLRIPFSTRGKICFFLMQDGQTRARGSLRLDELTGSNKSVIKKNVPLKWESPATTAWHPTLLTELRLSPEPPENIAESVWGMSFHQDPAQGTSNQDQLLFPRTKETVVGASIWTGMLNESAGPFGADSKAKPHRKPGPSPLQPIPSDDYQRPPTYSQHPPYDQRPAYDQRPQYEHRPPYDQRPMYDQRPSTGRPIPEQRQAYGLGPTHDQHHGYDTQPFAPPYSPDPPEGSFLDYAANHFQDDGGMYDQGQTNNHGLGSPRLNNRQQSARNDYNMSPYREHSAAAQTAFQAEYVSSGKSGNMIGSGAFSRQTSPVKVNTTSPGSSATSADDAQQRVGFRQRFFGGHKKSDDARLLEEASRNEVSAVVSQNLVKKFTQHRL